MTTDAYLKSVGIDPEGYAVMIKNKSAFDAVQEILNRENKSLDLKKLDPVYTKFILESYGEAYAVDGNWGNEAEISVLWSLHEELGGSLPENKELKEATRVFRP